MSAKIISDSTVTIFHNGTVMNAQKGCENYDRVLAALRDDDYALAMALLDRPKMIEEYTKGSSLRIEGYSVYYGDHALPDALTRRILEMHDTGFDIKPMERFVQKLYQNTSYRAIAETYRFLEHNRLPITDDGDFLAYKRIRRDWKDQWSGSIDNSIGQVVEMPREEVDDNCNNTCSSGLHFASLGYLSSFSGSRLIAIKINPRDVVSIPTDYNNTKGRCCRYEVVEELSLDLVTEDRDQWSTPVVEGWDEYCDQDERDREMEAFYEHLEDDAGAREALRNYLDGN